MAVLAPRVVWAASADARPRPQSSSGVELPEGETGGAPLTLFNSPDSLDHTVATPSGEKRPVTEPATIRSLAGRFLAELNFFRIHLLVFAVLPFIASGILFAANGSTRVSYLDCLFLAFSYMTLAGLNPVLIAPLARRQQVIIFLLMIVGSTSTVSIVMICVRRHYFHKRFRDFLDDRIPHEKDEKRSVIANGRTSSATPPESLRPPHRRAASSPGPLARPMSAGPTAVSAQSMHRTRSAVTKDLGGFPNPLAVGLRYAYERAPAALQPFERSLHRAATIPVPDSPRDCASVYSTVEGVVRRVHYISFDAIVGRNSAFRQLTPAQENELGGVEYRALTVLLWIVVAYCLIWPLLAFVVIAPYLARSEFDRIFDAADGTGTSPVWFSMFYAYSAFSNTGSSLLDASLIPFQDTYLLLVLTMFAILAGNTALPIFLRFSIWLLVKIVPAHSRTSESLRFLLDHPRRCYIYLFPAYQTWFLAFVLLFLNAIDWASFLILDIGNPVIEAIPLNVRVLDGLVQAIASRTGGFTIVPLASVAPAVQILYVLMMYISVYPIAMSIRSTNVYESRSLGIFDDNDHEDEAEEAADANMEDAQHALSYLRHHMRRQLSFDLWWLAFALFVVAIAERGSLTDASRAGWFNGFSIIFELVSGYGTVGISLGTPYSATSFCAAWSPVSKLMLIIVMLRGRHRGLPHAIDRAVMLPSDLASLRERSAATPTRHEKDAEALAYRSRLHRASRRFFASREALVPA